MKFRILGPLEALDDGAVIHVVAGKQRALLADLLLHANRAVPVNRLVDDLWGERAPETAVKAIQVNVSRLRKVLPAGRLRTHGPGYVLEVGDDELDLLEFRRLAEAGRKALADGDPESAADLLAKALLLWRGPALAEIDEPFAEIEATRLEELRLGCLEQRLEADLRLGRHALLVPELEALVAAEPLRESLRAQLMLALYRSGRQAESLEVHQSFRRMLDEELGIEPGQPLRDLERRILQQDPGLDWLAPGSSVPVVGLPTPSPAASETDGPDPVGRERELAAFARFVGETVAGARRVVFVSGEAGGGKTTLVDAGLAGCERSASILVARGQCIEGIGRGEPYLPVLDAVGRLGRGPASERVVAHLRRFAPTWLAQLPSLVDDDEREWIARRASGITTERMLREMAETLDALADEIPVVLVLEDLHWSDPSTLALVDAIARRPGSSRLMLVGTYRSGEEGARAHALARSLRLRNLCVEIAAAPFGEDAVAEYLDRRLPGHDLPEDLVEDVTRRTRGVPLFVEKLVDSWLDGGAVVREGAAWVLGVPLEQLRHDVPSTLRELILEQFRPLEQSTRDVLSAASVVGSEFTTALAAAGAGCSEDDAEDVLERLAGTGTFISRRGDVRLPDGTDSTGYRFSHDLCQETLYDAVPRNQRKRMHGMIGERLERGYGEGAAEVAADLAWHFTRSGDAALAVRHLLAAAERAFGRTAAEEARGHVEAAIALLPEIPDAEERSRAEYAARLLEGSVRILIDGWGSPVVEESLVRSVELARGHGAVGDEARALVALGGLYEIRGRYGASGETVGAVLALSENEVDHDLLVASHELLACSLVHQGRHAEALGSADLALEIAGAELLAEPVAIFGESPRVSSHVWAALALWHLGKPDAAVARAERAVATAAIAPRSYARGMAIVNMAIVSQCVGDAAETLRWADAAIDSSRRAGYPYWTAVASVLRGWAIAVDEDFEEGLALLQEGLHAARATGARLDDAYFLALLADVHRMHGDVEAGLRAVDAALEEMRGERAFFCEPELHRLRGELLLLQGDDARGVGCIEKAAAVAREQGALSYELRAALSLTRHRRDRASAEDLARVLGRLGEGERVPDVVAARAILAELGVPVPTRSEQAARESAASAPLPTAPPETRGPIRYAESAGLSIAFQVTGRGAVDLLLVPGFVSHLEKDWEEPRHAHFLDRLGSFSRLIRFDKRGTGLSDRPEGVPDLETRMDDLRAVMDAAGSERAVVFGYSEGGPLAILFAATYPERVHALVLFGAFVKRGEPDEDYPWAPSSEVRAAQIESVLAEWGFESDMKLMCPSADDAMARWWGERCRAAASPGAVRALMEMNSRIDVREALSTVHVPTVVIHRGTDFRVSPEEGRYIASRIAGARFVELDGADHFPAIDPDQILDAVEPFVRQISGEAPASAPAPDDDRVLATMMFTDIVGSTGAAKRLGDAAWARLLEQHHAIVRADLARFAGDEIDTAGDGFFAVFEGPARAVRCARSITERLSAVGIDVRVGVHTGEVVRANGTLRGIGVHLAARVAGAAAAGEVLVTSTTCDLVAGSGLTFVDRGEYELRGFEGKRRLYAAT